MALRGSAFACVLLEGARRADFRTCASWDISCISIVSLQEPKMRSYLRDQGAGKEEADEECEEDTPGMKRCDRCSRYGCNDAAWSQSAAKVRVHNEQARDDCREERPHGASKLSSRLRELRILGDCGSAACCEVGLYKRSAADALDEVDRCQEHSPLVNATDSEWVAGEKVKVIAQSCVFRVSGSLAWRSPAGKIQMPRCGPRNWTPNGPA